MLMGLKCVKVLLILSNNVSHSPLKKKKEKIYCIPLNDTCLTRRMQTKVSATKQNIPIGKKPDLEISGLALCTKRYLPPGQAQEGVKRKHLT